MQHRKGKQPDQDAVYRHIAKGVSEIVHYSYGESIAYRELKQFKRQQQADEEMRMEGGIPTYAQTLLYLRCLRALGKNVMLERIPTPIPSIAELYDAGLLDPDDNATFDQLIYLIRLEAESSEMALEEFNRLKRGLQ